MLGMPNLPFFSNVYPDGPLVVNSECFALQLIVVDLLNLTWVWVKFEDSMHPSSVIFTIFVVNLLI